MEIYRNVFLINLCGFVVNQCTPISAGNHLHGLDPLVQARGYFYSYNHGEL